MATETKTWTDLCIIGLLQRSDKAVDRAMITLSKHMHAVSYDDKSHVLRFADYVQGLDGRGKKKWKPKPLASNHAKIFIAQGFVPKGTRTLDFARDLAIRHAHILKTVANGEPVLRLSYFIYTIRSGRYADTQEMHAYRTDCLPQEKKGFPLDIEHRGIPTENDYQLLKMRYAPAISCPVNKEDFLSRYTLVYRREHYLD